MLRGQEEIAVLIRMSESLSLLLPQYLGLRFLTKAAGRCSTSIQLHFKVRGPAWIPSTVDKVCLLVR